jgi:hypothetical protein
VFAWLTPSVCTNPIVCLFVWWVSKPVKQTLPKTSLPVALLRVAKERIPFESLTE